MASPEGNSGCGCMFVLLFMVVGVLGILQGFGFGEFLGKPLVPNWVIGMVGVTFLCLGLSILLQAFGGDRWAVKGLGWIILFAIAATLHYLVFVDDLDGWSGPSLGPLSAGEVMRLFVVTVDFYVVLDMIARHTGAFGGTPGSFIKRLQGLEPAARTRVAIAILAAPLALAVLLHATGMLDRIGAAFGQHNASNRTASRVPKPTRPLKEFAGWWGDAAPFGPGWVTRVIVRTEGKDAWVRLWHSCPPNHCEEGEFKAKVHGNPPDHVELLEIRRDEGRLTRSIELGPNAAGPDWIMITERRIRGRNWNTNQQSVSGMKRVK